MITTATWLLGAAGASLMYIVDKMGFEPLTLLNQKRMVVVSLFGLFISSIAAYLIFLYGGYANRNWAKAKQLENKPELRGLVPEDSTAGRSPEDKGMSRLADFAWQLARPCDPAAELAPVFFIYAVLAIVCVLAHGCFFIWASCVE
jgi:hypothetical protein